MILTQVYQATPYALAPLCGHSTRVSRVGWAVWLVSDAAGKVTGRRFLGVHWDPELPPEQAAEKAGAPVAWTSIATMPITPSRS